MVRNQPRRSWRADEHGNHDYAADSVESCDGGDGRNDHQSQTQWSSANADALRKTLIEGRDLERPPEQRRERSNTNQCDEHAPQFHRHAGKRNRVEQRRPPRRVQPDQAFQISIQRVLDVEMHRRGVGLLEQEHSTRKHGGKDHAHRGTGFNPAQSADQLDRTNGNDGGSSGSDQHGPCGYDPGYEKCNNDTRQYHMADCISDQGLFPQHQKVSG